ncbi:MAG: hypothetical protein JW925_13960 [Syntrophaceae bacterium]|nr:hypothetical protein [Syntrophaceae bacterium]
MTDRIKEVIRRIFLGTLMGAFIGGMDLWFYEFNLRHGIAALLSGAFFGLALGIFCPLMKGIKLTILMCAGAGGLAGVVWWIIASSPVSIFVSIVVGVVLGILFARN